MPVNLLFLNMLTINTLPRTDLLPTKEPSYENLWVNLDSKLLISATNTRLNN